MAGGKGTRMKLPKRSPNRGLRQTHNHYVLAALKAAKKISRIIVATSQTTPQTTALMRTLGR
jgi:GTP:adenosylcobinamide-phosphate guanylyltransferase